MKTSILLMIAMLGVIALLVLRIVYAVSFDMSCTQYLKRAADANTIELASRNLETAIQYAEEKHLTNGIVSVFLHQPANDIGFWYSNLKDSQEELKKVTDKTTQLERSNILMKLGETLADNTENGTAITCPVGISVYPHNVLYFWLFVTCFIFIAGGGALKVILD